MIPGLSLDYTCTRLAARLAARPDGRHWAQWHACRSVAALLQAARESAAGELVAGISWPGSADGVELALRQAVRGRIAEAGRWAPEPWRDAIAWVAHLVDLPALVHLVHEAPVPAWIGADPVLGAYVLPGAAQRRAALAAGALAPLAAAALPPSAPPPGRRRPPRDPLHPALRAWQQGWRRRWPRPGPAARAGLAALEARCERHLRRMAEAVAIDASADRDALDAALRGLWRRDPGAPAALFAALALFALDVERLRAELLPRVRLAEDGGPAG